MKKLLKETIESAKRKKFVREQEVKRVNVETTVQEKAVAFPTDGRLYHKMRDTLVWVEKVIGIKLRQSYERRSKRSLIKQGRYSHAKQMKRARNERKKLKVYLGRVMRDIQRKCPTPNEALKNLLTLSRRIFNQQRKDTNKVYSACPGSGVHLEGQSAQALRIRVQAWDGDNVKGELDFGD